MDNVNKAPWKISKSCGGFNMVYANDGTPMFRVAKNKVKVWSHIVKCVNKEYYGNHKAKVAVYPEPVDVA